MPDVLPLLTATRWIRFATSGRTSPALIGCDLPGDGEVECVVKLGGHRESAPHQPVCETVAALLAVDLGLPVAEPMLVEISPDFVRHAIPAAQDEARTRCANALGIAFATKLLPPGFGRPPVDKRPSRNLLPALAELYAFDGLIHNADRSAANTNLLVKGDDLRFFDHDQAFGFLLDLFGAKSFDDPESYPFLSKHFAYPFLARDRTLFARLERAWQCVTPQRVLAYRELLPDAWPGKQRYFPLIVSYLSDLHPKLASALDAITLTLPASS